MAYDGGFFKLFLSMVCLRLFHSWVGSKGDPIFFLACLFTSVLCTLVSLWVEWQMTDMCEDKAK